MSGELGGGERYERKDDIKEGEEPSLEEFRRRIFEGFGPDGGLPHMDDGKPTDAEESDQENEFEAFAMELQAKYREEVVGTAPEKLGTESEHFGAIAPTERGEDLRQAVEPPVVGSPDEVIAVKGKMDDSNAVSGETTNSDPGLGSVNVGPTPEKLPEARRFAGGAKSSEDVSNVDVMADNNRVNEDSKKENSGRRSSEEVTEGIAKGPAVETHKGVELTLWGDVSIIAPSTAKESTAGDPSRRERRLDELHSPSSTESSKAQPEMLPVLESSKIGSHAGGTVETGTGTLDSKDAGTGRAAEYAEKPLAIITLKAYEYQIPGRQPTIRFDIRSENFQQRTGAEMREGKVYEIRGKIGEVWFTKNHLEKEGNHVIIMVPRERKSEVRPGQRYDIVIESVEEKTKFMVEGYRDGRTILDFQPSILASLGLDSDRAKESGVVAFAVENLSRPREGRRTLFTRIEPYDGAARLAVTGLGWRSGDLVRVNKVTDYSREDFVIGFNESTDTKRARLLLNGDKLSLEVDGRLFPMTNLRFGTHSLQVNLSARMEPTLREMRFWYDGEHYTPKIRDCRVHQFRASKHELKIVHDVSNNRITASRFTLPEASELPIIAKPLDPEMIRHNLNVAPRSGGPEGRYDFEVKPPLNSYLDAWLRAPNWGQLSQRRGTLGEELASMVLEELGWSQVRKHPSVLNGVEVGSNKPGFDRLMCWEHSRELALFELRWQQNLESAFSSARSAVLDRIAKNPLILKDPEKGAYIGILAWRQNEQRGTLHVKRVWPTKQGADALP